MSQQGAKKLGFFMALSMLIGSVVGIGIFFKSHGILRQNDWNGTGTFLAWLIGGLLSLSAAVSYGEISSFRTKNVHGLAAWSEKVGGKKYGYFVRFNYSFFYCGLLTVILGVFGSEMIFNLITTFSNGKYAMKDFPMYIHVLLGAGISLFFLMLNILSVKTSGWVASVTTILKWIPLLIVAFAGIGLASTNELTNPPFGQNAFTNGQSFTFTGMLAALPAVLFAFDSFIGVGTMRVKMKKPEKLPLVIVVGMVSVLVLYLLVALSAILHGSGMVTGMPFGAQFLGIFGQIFSKDLAEAMGKFTIVFIAVSTMGVINGVSAFSVASHEQAIRTNTIFGLKSLKSKKGDFKSLLIYTFLVSLFWITIFAIPAAILNSDSIIDGLSNFPTLFFFGIYGTTILLYLLKRDKHETQKNNNFVFKTFAFMAIGGILFLVSYQLIYGFFINAILHPTETTHWGLYAGDTLPDNPVAFPSKTYVTTDASGKHINSIGIYMSLAQASIIFFVMLLVFFSFPILSAKLTKRFEQNDVIINTQIEKK